MYVVDVSYEKADYNLRKKANEKKEQQQLSTL